MADGNRERRNRKVTAAALALSAAAHVAALAWLSFPTSTLETRERTTALLPPLDQAPVVVLTEQPAPAATEAGGTGTPGAPAQAAAAPSQATETPTRAESFLAAADSLVRPDVIPAVELAPVTVVATAAPVAVADAPPAPSAAPAPPVYVPGAAAAAKGRGAATAAGSGGAGAQSGQGGIGISIGGGKGPKRHPPVLMPGWGRR